MWANKANTADPRSRTEIKPWLFSQSFVIPVSLHYTPRGKGAGALAYEDVIQLTKRQPPKKQIRTLDRSETR